MVASECIKNEDEPWAYKNIHEGFGPIFWEWIKPNTIGNVGVMAGKWESMKNLLMLNWMVSQSGDTQHFTDQSALNLIINNSLLKDKIQLDSNFALQVDSLKSDKRFEKTEVGISGDVIMNVALERAFEIVGTKRTVLYKVVVRGNSILMWELL